MPFLKINDHQIYYEEYGRKDDPPVVLLHHGLGSTYSWKEQVKPLVDAGFHVILYDRWGYGRSERRDEIKLPGFEDDLLDLENLLNDLHLDRAALVGHSDGGTIALYFAWAHPKRVSALVTVAAHIYVEEKMQPAIYAIRGTFQNDPRFREGLRRLHGDKVEKTFSNWFDGWVKPESLQWNMLPLLEEIQCPALIVQGMDDEHATPRHAQDIAAGIPGAELKLVEGAGHMLPQEQAGVLNEMVVSFLLVNWSYGKSDW